LFASKLIVLELVVTGEMKQFCEICEAVFTPKADEDVCAKCTNRGHRSMKETVPQKTTSTKLDAELYKAMLVYFPETVNDDKGEEVLQLNPTGKYLVKFFQDDTIGVRTVTDVANVSKWLGGTNDWKPVHEALSNFKVVGTKSLKPADFGKVFDLWEECVGINQELKNAKDNEHTDGSEDDSSDDESDKKLSKSLMPAKVYNKLMTKFAEKSKLPRRFKPSHDHLSEVYNAKKAGLFPVVCLSKMTNVITAHMAKRAKTKKGDKYEYTRGDDGELHLTTASGGVEPDTMGYRTVEDRLRTHAAACAIVGLCEYEDDVWENHIEQVLRTGKNHGRERGYEFLDCEYMVRGEVSTAFLENGGSLTKALRRVYVDATIARDLWDEMVHDINPENTHKKQAEKKKFSKGKGAYKGGAGGGGMWAAKPTSTWSNPHTSPVPADQDKFEKLCTELGLTWWWGSNKVCYDFNLKEGGCSKPKCWFTHMCAKCGKENCSIRKGHPECMAQIASAKGSKGKGKGGKKGK
jgi:hypothetical protein